MLRLLLISLLIPFASSGQYALYSTTDFPGSARDDGIAFSTYEGIYAGTGMDIGFQLTSDIHFFSTESETWTPAFSDLQARQYAAACGCGRFGFVTAGTSTSSILNDVWQFDEEYDLWANVGTIPGSRRMKHFAECYHGNLIVGLGEGDTSILTDVYMFNPVNREWDTLPAFPEERMFPVSFVIGDYVYVGLGLSYAGAVNSFYRLHPYQGSWEAVAAPPIEPRMNAMGTAFNGYGIVGLGEVPAGNFMNDLWRYDAASGGWDSLELVLDYPLRGAMSASYQDVLVITAGLSDLGREYASFLIEADEHFFTVNADYGKHLTLTNPTDEPVDVLIYDMHGRKLYEEKNRRINNFTAIVTEKLSTGVYVLRLEQNGEVLETRKFVKP